MSESESRGGQSGLVLIPLLWGIYRPDDHVMPELGKFAGERLPHHARSDNTYVHDPPWFMLICFGGVYLPDGATLRRHYPAERILSLPE